MHILTPDQRVILLTLNDNRSGYYFRKDEEKREVLNLCKMGLVCDPHGEDSEAFFTRITDDGLEVANVEKMFGEYGLSEDALVHFSWAADVGREARDMNMSFEEYRAAAKVIMMLNSKVRGLMDISGYDPAMVTKNV